MSIYYIFGGMLLKSSVCLLITCSNCFIRNDSRIARSCLLFCCQGSTLWGHLGSSNIVAAALLAIFFIAFMIVRVFPITGIYIYCQSSFIESIKEWKHTITFSLLRNSIESLKIQTNVKTLTLRAH